MHSMRTCVYTASRHLGSPHRALCKVERVVSATLHSALMASWLATGPYGLTKAAPASPLSTRRCEREHDIQIIIRKLCSLATNSGEACPGRGA